MDTEQAVRKILVEELAYEGDPAELTRDLPLLDSGVLDSLGVFRVLARIEEQWDIEIPDDALVPETFATIGSLAAVVDTQLA